MKKAQLKIQEMAFMLVAVVLFFLLAGLFVFSIFYSNLKKSADIKAEENTLAILDSAIKSPELSCIDSSPDCIDSDKAIFLAGNLKYADLWKLTSLRIMKVSSFNKSESSIIYCTKLNYPKCDAFLMFDKKIQNERMISGFAALCRSERDNDRSYMKCEVAKVVAGLKINTAG